MKINELENFQTVRCRTGRAGREGVEWDNWTDEVLYIQRMFNKKYPQGIVTIITLQDRSWAEYDPRHNEFDNGVFAAEDYYLEVLGLTK